MSVHRLQCFDANLLRGANIGVVEMLSLLVLSYPGQIA